MSDNVNDKRDHNISSREGANLMQSSGEVAHGLGKVPCGSHRDQTERSRSYPWGVCPGVVNDIINIRNDTVDDKKAALLIIQIAYLLIYFNICEILITRNYFSL